LSGSSGLIVVSSGLDIDKTAIHCVL
jgi:phospholipase C